MAEVTGVEPAPADRLTTVLKTAGTTGPHQLPQKNSVAPCSMTFVADLHCLAHKAQIDELEIT